MPGTAQNARAVAGLGLDESTVAAVLGGNATAVYAGLSPGRSSRRTTPEGETP